MQYFMRGVVETLGKNKLEEMALLIVDMSPLGIIGERKLRALIWLCDRGMYIRNAQTISGKKYIKGTSGPELLEFTAPVYNISGDKVLVKRPSRLFTGEVTEYISLKSPIFMSLSPEDREVIKQTVDRYVSADLEEVLSDARGQAWEITEWGKPIPMYAVLADKTRELTVEDLQWAAEDEQHD